MDQKNGKPIEAKRLQNLYVQSAVNKAAFDYFARRHRNSAGTKIERLQDILRLEGHDASRRDIIDLFKALADANCGEFVVGRKGHSSRFVWAVSMTAVGQAAAGESVTLEKLSEEDKAAAEIDDDIGMIDHKYFLRPDVEITVSLPRDASPVEVSRVADFVRTLSFQR